VTPDKSALMYGPSSYSSALQYEDDRRSLHL
jgi:hypothetical protein